MEALRDARPAVQWPPTCPLPEAEREPFERGGLLTTPQPWCLAERYEGTRNVTWSTAYIDKYCAAMAAGNVTGNYGPADTKVLLEGLRSLGISHGLAVQHSTALVMGTENPWVECLLLNEGARLVTTFEYGKINVEHPKMRASLCQDIAIDFLAGRFEPVDLIVSYSSLEHSGLGRYGDALNPDGDKDAVAQVRRRQFFNFSVSSHNQFSSHFLSCRPGACCGPAASLRSVCQWSATTRACLYSTQPASTGLSG